MLISYVEIINNLTLQLTKNQYHVINKMIFDIILNVYTISYT
jgi:hypothetical protein